MNKKTIELSDDELNLIWMGLLIASDGRMPNQPEPVRMNTNAKDKSLKLAAVVRKLELGK